MTDMTTSAPVHETRAARPGFAALVRPRREKRALGFGKGFVAALAAYGRALESAYVAPFSKATGKPMAMADEDLKGRDPNW